MKKRFADKIWQDEDAHLINIFFPHFAGNLPKKTRLVIRFMASVALMAIVTLGPIFAITKSLHWPAQFLFVFAPALVVAVLLFSSLFRRAVIAQSQSLLTQNFYKPAAWMSTSFALPPLLLTVLPLFLPDEYVAAGLSFSASSFSILVFAWGMIFSATTRYFRRLSQI